MRRALPVLAAVVAVSVWANPGRSQTTGFSDPFFLYYGYYLPQQNALANQPRIQDTINANVAANQAYAQTNRASLYDPAGGFGRFDPNAATDPFDPNAPRGAAGGAGRAAGAVAGVRPTNRGGIPSSNLGGMGPPGFFNRTAQYYPSMRVGYGPNKNVRVPGRGVRGGGGMMGMGMPQMPGPR